MTKERYLARVSYDNEFKPELEKFIKLIYLDKKLDPLFNEKQSQRFSGVIRWLIKKYNDQRGSEIIEEFKKAKSLSPAP